VPFCCIVGAGEQEDKSKVAYYDLSATWMMPTTPSDAGTLKLNRFSATLSDAQGPAICNPWHKPGLQVTKGRPTGLAFLVFSSGDDWYVVFSRPQK
jgi:hypothetical protein